VLVLDPSVPSFPPLCNLVPKTILFIPNTLDVEFFLSLLFSLFPDLYREDSRTPVLKRGWHIRSFVFSSAESLSARFLVSLNLGFDFFTFVLVIFTFAQKPRPFFPACFFSNPNRWFPFLRSPSQRLGQSRSREAISPLPPLPLVSKREAMARFPAGIFPRKVVRFSKGLRPHYRNLPLGEPSSSSSLTTLVTVLGTRSLRDMWASIRPRPP